MTGDVLQKAKDLQRSYAANHQVAIRVSLLEDLIAEIEKLRHQLGEASPGPLQTVIDAARKRQGGQDDEVG